jgi:gliding motility-associated-like protein
MPLNGDVNDISGNNNQGINHGATPSTDRKGNANGAMHFNGTDSWIEVPNSPSIQSPEQALSVSSWIRAESEAIYFICKVNGPSYNQYQFRTGINLLSKQYFLGINGADYCWEDTILADLALNEWFLFTITYDGSEIKFYFNGELSNTYLHSQLINPNSERLEIGRDAHGPIEWMMGDLDDLRIYNVALTAEQVACIYYENCIDLVLDANLSDETICNNDHSELEIINAQTSVSYQLLKDGSVYGSPQTGNLDTLVFPISNILETSTFKVVATDLNTGCSITLDSVFTVEVLSPEVEALVITDSDYAPAAASLSSTSRDAVVFEWYQDGNLIATTEQAQVDLPAPGEYTFVLVAGSGPPANCSDSDTVRITLQVPVNVVLEIPNAFTPNNDGINDFFEITTEGITKSDVWIKDRWGLLIAEFDGQTGHWDGLNGSGKEAPAGPYYFHVEAIDYAGKTMEESGVVYLVREMIELSPNPAVQQIMINMKGCLPGERTLQISSVQGVSFFQESFSDEIFKVDISKIKPGIYFVKISNGKDQQYLKFVKE